MKSSIVQKMKSFFRSIPKKTLQIFCLVVISLSLSSCSTINSFKLWVPKWFGLEPLVENIYVDKNMALPQREALQAAIITAREQIRLHFGEVTSAPDIIACSTESCYRSLSGVTARAKAYGSSKLLLSPRGITAPMISHEWSHAELYDRMGGFRAANRLPRWFIEGLAVVVSDEPTHSEKVWSDILTADIAIPKLNGLESLKDWLAAARKYDNASFNPNAYKVVYTTAGHEVRLWFTKVGTTGLHNLINSIKQDIPFAQAYKQAVDD